MKMTPATERTEIVSAMLLAVIVTASRTKREMTITTTDFVPGLSKLLGRIEIRLYYNICHAWMVYILNQQGLIRSI